MSELVSFVCPRCSTVIGDFANEKVNCRFCNTLMIETDVLYKDAFRNRQSLKEKYAYSNPLYNEKLDKQIREQVRKEVDNIKPASQNSNIPKCPTCGSTNIKRISTANRAVSIGLFGLLSGKIGKNYECRNCKAKW